jgi:hypothetical protein
VEHYIPGWRVHLLNKGGRLTLTNVVLMAQLTYAANAIKFPNSIVEWIDKSHRGMLWKGIASFSSGDYQVAWALILCLKGEGGLNVRNIETQNICLLLKNLGQLHQGHNNPWGGVCFWYTRNAPHPVHRVSSCSGN